MLGIPYHIKFTDQTLPGKISFTIDPNTTDGPITPIIDSPDSTATAYHTSVALPGMGIIQYGERIAKAIVHIMENFASAGTAPVAPTTGQLWYDYSVRSLKVYNFDGTTGVWDEVGGSTISQAVQAALNQKVSKAGDTMTGFLVLKADPTLPLHAATKQYVDAHAGTPGPTGPIGPQGLRGLTGPASTTPGPQGPQGDQGPQGPQGYQGAQGPAGSSTGTQGPQGPQGPKGDTGAQGPAGADGSGGGGTGSVGPQGPAGPTGPQGPQGNQGPAGASVSTDFNGVGSYMVGSQAGGGPGSTISASSLNAVDGYGVSGTWRHMGYIFDNGSPTQAIYVRIF